MTSGERQDGGALVCFAVKAEARFFKPAPEWRTPARVTITGIGKKNAARVVQRVVDQMPPTLVLTCGFAGGLNPDWPRGTIAFSVDDGLNLASTLVRLGAKPGRFYCSARVVLTAEEKHRLCKATSADAVDMESEVIRKLCRERGIPSATIRIISDAADEDLPLDFNALMT